MSDMNFDQEATVSWSDHLILGSIKGGIGHTQPFSTLREALVFVTEKLPEDQRGNAWVMTEGHTYNFKEAAELREQMH